MPGNGTLGAWDGSPMCETPAPSAPRPRWTRLYVLPPLLVAALVLVERSVSATAPRIVLEFALTGGAWWAMAAWVRANRIAIDQADWCACASHAITVRVIQSPVRAPAPARSGGCAIPDDADVDALPVEPLVVSVR